MQSVVTCSVENFKILWSIVFPISVLVMDDFGRQQNPPEHFFGNPPVLVLQPTWVLFASMNAVSAVHPTCLLVLS